MAAPYPQCTSRNQAGRTNGRNERIRKERDKVHRTSAGGSQHPAVAIGNGSRVGSPLIAPAWELKDGSRNRRGVKRIRASKASSYSRPASSFRTPRRRARTRATLENVDFRPSHNRRTRKGRTAPPACWHDTSGSIRPQLVIRPFPAAVEGWTAAMPPGRWGCRCCRGVQKRGDRALSIRTHSSSVSINGKSHATPAVLGSKRRTGSSIV